MASEQGDIHHEQSKTLIKPQQSWHNPPRRYCIAGCTCCGLFSLTAFLLLFFLIPRAPRCNYESTVVTFNPYVVTQTYKIYNQNQYSLTLSDWNMLVETSTAIGTFQSGSGSLTDDDNSFSVAKNSNSEFSLVYHYNITAQQQQAINQQCKTAQGVTYTTSGSVNMKTWAHNFDDISLGPWTTTYYCN